MEEQNDVVQWFELGEDNEAPFETQLAKTNGTRYWFARELMPSLGYKNWSAFTEVINKAIRVCTSVNINIFDNFIAIKRQTADDENVDDFKLSRMACCLIAMNADSKLPVVAQAQAYFAALAVVIDDHVHPANLDRISLREEISDREVTISKAAAAAGVTLYDRFQDAGYQGMYNMDYPSLKRLKGIPDMRRSLLDFMGKDELAANLFRLTLTEGRIRRDQIKGQAPLQQVANHVGKAVRQMMIDETGIRPEDLPIGPDIRKVKKGLRAAHKGFADIDDLAAQRTIEAAEQERTAQMLGERFPDCAECQTGNRYAHEGSPQCSSGSIASGGTVAHCHCDYCSIVEVPF